jgi:hypothetical protein
MSRLQSNHRICSATSLLIKSEQTCSQQESAGAQLNALHRDGPEAPFSKSGVAGFEIANVGRGSRLQDPFVGRAVGHIGNSASNPPDHYQ